MNTFPEIFGQTSAVDMLRCALAAERLPHGMIFAGPVGVGKATTARALGKLFLCENPKGEIPCGTCESCRVFDAGNHPDWHVITKELIRYHDKTGKSKGIDLSINVIRPELIEPANRKSTMGRGKVFVVEQAELMNPQAQNAMLKTLEEPAGRTVVILLTDAPEALLPTIRSRCQTIPFAALDGGLVRKQLEKRGIEKNIAVDATDLASGSLGQAIRLVEDGVVERARELGRMMDTYLSGKPLGDLPGWFKQSAEAYAEKQLERDELASKDAASRQGMALYLRIAAARFRARLIESDDADELERACQAIDAIARAEMYLDANVNVSVVFQQLAVALESTLVTAL